MISQIPDTTCNIEEAEMQWRCWNCQKICKASARCNKCNTAMTEYEGDDISAILVFGGEEEEQNE